MNVCGDADEPIG